MMERLQKVLAHAGIASRRAAEDMILEGRISVNGRIVDVLGCQVGPDDDIRVDGVPVKKQAKKRYVILNKPVGYVTTLSDPQGRPTVKDLVASLPERLYPVGRLDYDSEGLLLMTNDGDLAYHLQHPKFSVPKMYRVKVVGHVLTAHLHRLEAGVELSDGLFKPVKIDIEKMTSQSTWLKLTITEGRNRIIRRALTAMGYSVRRLIRLEIGGLKMGALKTGEFRDLTAAEIQTLAIY